MVRQQKKNESNKFLPVGFGILLITILISVVLTFLVFNKTKTIAAQQQQIVALFEELEKAKELEEEKAEVTSAQEESKSLATDSVSRKEFEAFKKEYQREINRLKREVRRIRGLL